jgi:hypothetical protein
METVETSQKPFDIDVIFTTEKPVPARPEERIEGLKVAAMHRFGIPKEKANDYRLATSPGNPQSVLDDNKTVADYHLRQGSKLYLEKPHNDA